MPPGRKVAVVACMDARINPYGILGLQEGDAHVIRNAGGVITDDEIRSLAISQRLLGHRGDHPHPPHRLRDAHVRRHRVPRRGGGGHGRPGRRGRAEAFSDVEDDVRKSLGRIQDSPFIPRKDSVRGFVYEVESGRLREVT